MSLILIPISLGLLFCLLFGFYLSSRLFKTETPPLLVIAQLLAAISLWIAIFFIVPFALNRESYIHWYFALYLLLGSGGLLSLGGLLFWRRYKQTDTFPPLLLAASMFIGAGLMPIAWGTLGRFLSTLWNIRIAVSA
jgi:hypothetical protein